MMSAELVGLVILHVSNVKTGEALWSHGYCACLQIETSGFEPWLGTLCCVLGQDT